MRKDLLIIFLIALAPRLILGLMCTVEPPYSDMAEYNALALGQHIDGLAAERTLGYPVFLAMIYKVFGALNFRAVFVIQGILGAMSCVLIYYIAGQVSTRRAALTAALVAAVYPYFIAYGATCLTETLAMFWILVALSLVFTSLTDIVKSTTLAVIIALAVWIRPACILFAPGFLLLLKKRWRFIWIAVPLCLLVVQGTKLGAINFYLSYNPAATGAFVPIDRTPLGSYDHSTMTLILAGLDMIRHHPWGTVAIIFQKIYVLFNYGFDTYVLRPIIGENYTVSRIFVFFYPLMAFFGFIGLIRYYDKRIALPFLSYLVLIILFSVFGYRFRLMFEPCLILFVGILFSGGERFVCITTRTKGSVWFLNP